MNLSQMWGKIVSSGKGNLHIDCVGVNIPSQTLALPTWVPVPFLHGCVCEPQFLEPTVFIPLASRRVDLVCSHPEFVQARCDYSYDLPPASHDGRALRRLR